MLPIKLRRDGFTDNHKRIYYVYREESLPIHKKRRAYHYQCDDVGTDPIERFVAFAEERPRQMNWLVCESVTSQA
jgi:hypothetical protein